MVSLLVIPSPIPRSIITIENPEIPKILANSTGDINVSVLYTGISPQQVSFTLTGPPGITIQNASQNMVMYPNQISKRVFNIIAGASPGTAIMSLSVSTAGGNQTINLPLVVSLQSQFQVQSHGILSFLWLSDNSSIMLTVVFLILIVLILMGLRRLSSGSKYDKKREEHLLRINKRIDFSSQDDDNGR